MRRSLVLIVACALILTGCSLKKNSEDKDAYRTDINTVAQLLSQAITDLSEATTKYAQSRQVTLSPTPAIIEDITAGIDEVRAANDALIARVGNAPSSFANVDAENTRITERTTTFLQQYKLAFAGGDTVTMLHLVSNQLDDVQQYQETLKTAGFL